MKRIILILFTFSTYPLFGQQAILYVNIDRPMSEVFVLENDTIYFQKRIGKKPSLFVTNDKLHNKSCYFKGKKYKLFFESNNIFMIEFNKNGKASLVRNLRIANENEIKSWRHVSNSYTYQNNFYRLQKIVADKFEIESFDDLIIEGKNIVEWIDLLNPKKYNELMFKCIGKYENL